MSKTFENFTAVQHSGFGYGGKREFERGLEVRTVGTQAEQDKVVKAGGVLFDTRAAANEFCDRAMWPGSQPGLDLVPRARGRFSDTQVDGLRIYIPATEVEIDAPDSD